MYPYIAKKSIIHLVYNYPYTVNYLLFGLGRRPVLSLSESMISVCCRTVLPVNRALIDSYSLLRWADLSGTGFQQYTLRMPVHLLEQLAVALSNDPCLIASLCALNGRRIELLYFNTSLQVVLADPLISCKQTYTL